MTKLLHPSSFKRLTIQGVMVLAIMGIVATLMLSHLDEGNPVEAAQAEALPQGMDLKVYTHVDQVRRGACLRSIDMAALGLSESETFSVLTRLVSWVEMNEKALTDTQQAVYRAERELGQQQRLVRIGQASERQLRDADGRVQAVVTARQAHDDLLKHGAGYAMQSAPDKADAWQRASELKGHIQLELRYISGMDIERLKQVQAETKSRVVKLEDVLFLSEQKGLWV